MNIDEKIEFLVKGTVGNPIDTKDINTFKITHKKTGVCFKISRKELIGLLTSQSIKEEGVMI